jgi:hypothetical protein
LVGFSESDNLVSSLFPGIITCLLFTSITWNAFERDYDWLLKESLAGNTMLLELEPDLVLFGMVNPKRGSSAVIASVFALVCT